MLTKEDCDLIMAANAIRDDDERADQIGAMLAEALKLRRDPTHRNRWQTTWGSKTNAGLARTIIAQIEGAIT